MRREEKRVNSEKYIASDVRFGLLPVVECIKQPAAAFGQKRTFDERQIQIGSSRSSSSCL